MIAPQTLNRLLGQDWTGILRSAADATAFKLMRVTLPNGKDDIWLDPSEGSPPSPRHTSPADCPPRLLHRPPRRLGAEQMGSRRGDGWRRTAARRRLGPRQPIPS